MHMQHSATSVQEGALRANKSDACSSSSMDVDDDPCVIVGVGRRRVGDERRRVVAIATCASCESRLLPSRGMAAEGTPHAHMLVVSAKGLHNMVGRNKGNQCGHVETVPCGSLKTTSLL